MVASAAEGVDSLAAKLAASNIAVIAFARMGPRLPKFRRAEQRLPYAPGQSWSLA
jgi:hypothetical protein